MLVENARWTGAENEDNVLAVLSDGSHIYATLNPNIGNGILLKIDPANMTELDRFTGGTGDYDTYGLTTLGDYVYIGNDKTGVGASAGTVIKLDKATLTEQARWENTGANIEPRQMANDGTYLYVCSGILPGDVVKIDPSTMTEVSRYDGSADPRRHHGLAHLGSYVYAAGNTAGDYHVVKINASTMALEDSFVETADGVVNGGVCHDGTNIYFTIGTSPGAVIKINVNNMSEDSRWTGNTGENKSIESVYDDVGALYTGCILTPGQVVKINTSNMQKVNKWVSSDVEDTMRVGYLSPYAYAGSFTSPANIIQLRSGISQIINIP